MQISISNTIKGQTSAGGGSSFTTNSFTFDGSSDFIDCSSAVDTVKTDTQGTISAWVKINDAITGMIFLVSDISTIRRFLYLRIKNDLKAIMVEIHRVG